MVSQAIMSSDSTALARKVLNEPLSGSEHDNFYIIPVPFKTTLDGSRFLHHNLKINEVWGWSRAWGRAGL
jgi:hypothetical protein